MATPRTPNGRSTPRLPLPGMSDSVMAPPPIPAIGFRGQRESRGFALPLHIIAMIVAHVDDLGDLARLTRTSRVLYYMTLPQLYQTVTLRSYPEVRRVNGRVEGLGGASPLCMTLAALSTTQSAGLVRNFDISGTWKETEEYKQGRIPDSTMLLNVVVRNALDKMANIRSFRWELSTKPLKTVYQGLALRPNLTTLTIKFPSTRGPRPIAILPGIPNLLILRVSNLDPTAYNDDLSVLLLKADKLTELQMHFNPRMRLEAESGLSLGTYFGKCAQAGHKLPLKKVGFQNFYGSSDDFVSDALIDSTLVETHFLDMFGGAAGSQPNVFIDNTWTNIPDHFVCMWKIHRTNEVAIQHVKILRAFKGLEELYLVGHNLVPRQEPNGIMDQQRSPKSSSTSPAATPRTPNIRSGSDLDTLGCEYMDVIRVNHGATLRVLLLSNKFAFGTADLAHLIRSCPNLEQLGLAIGPEGGDMFSFLLPFLPNLSALRILENVHFDQQIRILEWDEWQVMVAKDMHQKHQEKLKWIGMGSLKIFKVGPSKLFELEDGTDEWRRDFQTATFEDVQHVKIWSMDCLELK